MSNSDKPITQGQVAKGCTAIILLLCAGAGLVMVLQFMAMGWDH